MIKIERCNLCEIANNYLGKLKEKGYNKKNNNTLQKHWVKNKDRIIKSNDLKGIIKEFQAIRDQTGFDEFKNYMKGQYKELFYEREIGYWLAKQLDVKTCPYCNRQYTFTIETQKGGSDEKHIRPEFDHFYSKSEHPCLALSFYNLIPSCSICNRIKSDDVIDINPYENGFGNEYKFILKTKDSQEPFNWALNEDVDIDFLDENENIKVFGLKELYNEHIDYVKEIINKAQAYNYSYYSSLIDSYKGLGYQEEDIDRFIWGNYIENAEHEKRPLSKLTKDILEQLKIP